jgi:nucleoside-diphosphate-sugar epimerase
LNILVAGSSGFIGSRLIKKLEKSNHSVFESSRNNIAGKVQVKSWEEMEIEGLEIDLVVNTSGRYLRTTSLNNIKDIFDSNLGTAISISKSMKYISKGVLNLSSYFEFLPEMSENRKSHYTTAKVLANEVLSGHSQVNEISYSRIVLYDNYDIDLSRNKVLDALIKSSISDESIKINNEKSPINLIELNEIIDGVIKIIDSYESEDPIKGRIDLKSAESTNILEVINLITKISQKEFKYINEGFDVDPYLEKIIKDDSYRMDGFGEVIRIESFIRKILGKAG